VRAVWQLVEWPAAIALWGWVRLVFRTVRFDLEGSPVDGPAIYASWHRHTVVLSVHHGHFHRWMMTSPAPYLAPVRRLAQLVGIRTAVGTSGDGGARALEQLVRALQRGESVSLAIDGPAGPAFVAKRGCAVLAQRTGAPIVPIAYRTASAKTLHSRWDKMLWLRFFDRATIRYGSPIFAGAKTEREILAEVERALAALDPDIAAIRSLAALDPDIAAIRSRASSRADL